MLALTGRQFRLNTARTARRKALRWAVQRMAVRLPPVAARLARAYSGYAIRYPAEGHRMAGRRLPRGTVTLPNETRTRLHELLHDGRFVLLDRVDHGGLPDHVRGVRYADCTARLPRAVLIRPDGYIAWATDRDDPAAAVAHWCRPT